MYIFRNETQKVMLPFKNTKKRCYKGINGIFIYWSTTDKKIRSTPIIYFRFRDFTERK